MRSSPPPITAEEPPPIPYGAPEAFLDDVCSLLQQLIRFRTVNVGPAGPEAGDEAECADWCRARLEEVGIAVKVFDSAPGRRNLVASMGPDDGEALILSAHLDVVPVDEACWTKPAFEGLRAPDRFGVDCFWGRGAIDMKHGVAYGLAIMRELARTHGGAGEMLKRGLKLSLVADEEAGCRYGSLALVEAHPEWLRGAAVITEAGGFTSYLAPGKKLYPIQVAEKGFVWMKLKVNGTPGHGSVPTQEHALAKLAPLLSQIVEKPLFPFECHECVRRHLHNMADVVGGEQGWILRSASTPGAGDAVLASVGDGLLNALTHHTVAPSMVSSGTKVNVLPSSAELMVDCRILWGTDPDQFVEDFRTRFPGDYEIEVMHKGPPVENEYIGNPVYALAKEVLQGADAIGESHVVPSPIQGLTDARAYVQLGIPVYGCMPIWFPPEINFGALFHGHDERVPVHGLRWGSAVLREVVDRWCVRALAAPARI